MFNVGDRVAVETVDMLGPVTKVATVVSYFAGNKDVAEGYWLNFGGCETGFATLEELKRWNS